MPEQVDARLGDLYRTLDALSSVAVAVSGGVDSLTLACAAHSRLGDDAVMYHAVSPAVPPEATERTRQTAERLAWRLEIIEAGEFDDPDYLGNPANRCFFCKDHLYAAIARSSAAVLVSGTNLDDMSDFRPGLQAAQRYGVRHPYVEAAIDKAAVRDIARSLGLGGIAELPAAPCLSSRLQTGIRVDADLLKLVHAVEGLVARMLRPRTVRCRIRSEGVVVELDEAAYARATSEHNGQLRAEIGRLRERLGYPGETRFAPYKMGSAFVRAE